MAWPNSSWEMRGGGWIAVCGFRWGRREEVPLVDLLFLALLGLLLGSVGRSVEVPVAAPRGSSGSWTVRICFANASERVNALSHSTSPSYQHTLTSIYPTV